MSGPRKYEMRARARSYEETRSRIMEATFEMHRGKGVAATTFADVAGRAGVAPATVLRHFPTMGHLVDACGAHVWQSLEVPEPSEVFAGAGIGTPDRVRRLVDAVCGIYSRGEGPLAGARRDRAAVPELEALLERLDRALERLVREALRPLGASTHQVRLALALLDFGVWQSLRERGMDTSRELCPLLEYALSR